MIFGIFSGLLRLWSLQFSVDFMEVSFVFLSVELYLGLFVLKMKFIPLVCYGEQLFKFEWYSNIIPFVILVDLIQGGSTIILRNAKIDMFRGLMRPIVDKWGRVEVTNVVEFKVKENMSILSFEVTNVVELHIVILLQLLVLYYVCYSRL